MRILNESEEMKKVITFCALFCTVFIEATAQQSEQYFKIDTTTFQAELFVEKLIEKDSTDLDRAATLLHFVSHNLQWLPTDYKSRTINQILARGGGNCYELARVYMSFIRKTKIRYRPVQEIQLYTPSDDRQKRAEQLIGKHGNKLSVFGRQHNDHRWIEVYDVSSDEWYPVDPTMNVIGTDQWLKARVWFGDRTTMNPDITKDMIVPFAIFYGSSDQSKKEEVASRTSFYLVQQFDRLYKGQLSNLPSWSKWKALVGLLDEKSRLAFRGEDNLHRYATHMSELEACYGMLKKEYTHYVSTSTDK